MAPGRLELRRIGLPSIQSTLVLSGFLFGLSDAAIAQRIPVADGTLGTEQSIVSPDTPINGLPSNQIDGGAQRGANLFHSFREFNIDAGRGVYFTNPTGVVNILTRVTGTGRSDILGTLGVFGNANLFVLNPNGIVFGPNARLDIRGSFLASTATSVVFDNGFAFSTTNPQAPPLLTVNLPVGLQYGSNPGAIQTQGTNLQVQNGQTLTLSGGTVNIAGGQLLAPGGRVELAGVGNAGTVGLIQQGQEWRLSVPDGLARADVAIGNNANVSVLAGGGGSIAITAQNVSVTGTGTQIRAGINAGLGTIGAQAGNIDINATNAINLDASSVGSSVQTGGIGNAGNINITTGTLFLINGAQLLSSTAGLGNAGDIKVMVSGAATFDGTTVDGQVSSGILSQVNRGANGKSGNIELTADSLLISNGAQIGTDTSSRGDAGNVKLTVNGAAIFSGTTPNGQNPSGVFTQINRGANGRAGNIEITADSLTVINGAQLGSATQSVSNAGNVKMRVNGMALFDGTAPNNVQVTSGVYSQVQGGSGNGGNIELIAGSLMVSNGAALSVSTFGRGDAGSLRLTVNDAAIFDGTNPNGQVLSGAFSQVNRGATGKGGIIEITADSLTVRNGARLSAGTAGIGDGGIVRLIVNDAATFDGTAPTNTRITSAAGSVVGPGASGRGGTIELTAGILTVRNGAQLITSTFGRGDAGSVKLRINGAATFDGTTADGLVASGALSTVNPGAIGRGGIVELTADSLRVTNGAQLSANTFGAGDAGSVNLTVSDTVTLSSGARITVSTASSGQAGNLILNLRNQLTLTGNGTGLFASTTSGSTGNGGSIQIDPDRVLIQDGAAIAVNSRGRGTGGNISLQANRLELRDRGSITAETVSSQGGNIILNVQDLLLLQRHSQISATAGTAQAGGDGGNIAINAPNGFIVGVRNENSDITANAFTGNGGRVNITAQGIYGLQVQPDLTPFSDITASSTFGISGVVTLNTPDVDPSRGLVQLPVELTDASRLIVQACPTGDVAKRPNEFIITGRGGLPPTPSEAINRDAIQVDLVTINPDDRPTASEHHPTSNDSFLPLPSTVASIVEAQALQVAADGTFWLIATTDQPPIERLLHHRIHCH